MRRPALRIAPALALVALLAACASVPDEGPVKDASGPLPGPSSAPFDFDPPGPVPGASRAQTVAGFLGALQATPVSTEVARRFLTRDAVEGWHPERGTLVYRSQRARTAGSRVSVLLEESFELDRTGRWAGSRARQRVTFRLAREGGEWRIAGLPDATLVPEGHFSTRYQEYSLYFFDTTGEVLVPEPVYLQRGVQAPTQLVAGLLAGPQRADRATERSFLPRGTRLGVGVPVARDGTAEVPLNSAMRGLDPGALGKALVQLAWTLRQVEGVERLRVTADGAPVEAPGGRPVLGVDSGAQYSPVVAGATTDLFGVRGRDIVQVVGSSEVARTRLAAPVTRPRSLAADLTGQRYAVVDASGTQVHVLGGPADDRSAGAVATGARLLRPMWDRTGRLWVLGGVPGGAVRVVDPQGRARSLPAPGLAGTPVAAALSRDGTRLAVVEELVGGAQRLVVLGVVRAGSGQPVRLTPARRVTTATPLVRARAVGWRDPTSLAVLTRPSGTTSDVLVSTVDGSSGRIDLAPSTDVLFDAGVAMTAAPGESTPVLVLTRDGLLHGLSASGRWELEAVAAGLRLPTYAG